MLRSYGVGVTEKSQINHDVLKDTHKNTHLYSKILTLRSSSGRSPPSLMPLFMEIKRSTGGLSLTFGLCRLVFSMMMANDSTQQVSESISKGIKWVTKLQILSQRIYFSSTNMQSVFEYLYTCQHLRPVPTIEKTLTNSILSHIQLF